jgi:hypothetical protein
MKIKRVRRFICEFCHHGWFKEKLCLAHEKRCVQNPSRVCGFCENHEITQCPLFILVAMLEEDGLDIDKLREIARECPMCMLAAVMAVNKKEGWRRTSEEFYYFDYAKELRLFDERRGVGEFIVI